MWGWGGCARGEKDEKYGLESPWHEKTWAGKPMPRGKTVLLCTTNGANTCLLDLLGFIGLR